MSRFSQFTNSSGAPIVGDIREFASGTSPEGYLPLNRTQCYSKTAYPALFCVVGNQDIPATEFTTIPTPPPLCGSSALFNGSCICICQSFIALSAWGSDCVTTITANSGNCCGDTAQTCIYLCFCTADGNGGTISGFRYNCYSGLCSYITCACSVGGIFTFSQSNTKFVGALLRCCNNGCAAGIGIWNFTCKCFVCVYCNPSNSGSDDYCSLCDTNILVMGGIRPCVYKLGIPFNGNACACSCLTCGNSISFATCTSSEFGCCWCHFRTCPNGLGVKFLSCHCEGKEPAIIVSLGLACCYVYGGGGSCVAIMAWNLMNNKSRVQCACSFLSVQCQCPASVLGGNTGSPPGCYIYTGCCTSFGDSLEGLDFVAVHRNIYNLCAESSPVVCLPSDPVNTSLRCFQINTDIPCMTISCVNQAAYLSRVTFSNCNSFTSSNITCFFYNRKQCAWWGMAGNIDSTLPCYCQVLASCCSYFNCYCFCLTNSVRPITYGSSTYCSLFTDAVDPSLRLGAGSTGASPLSLPVPSKSACLFGFSTLGPSSNVFTLPSVPCHPIKGMAFYIKT
jgi:hypothetical protein